MTRPTQWRHAAVALIGAVLLAASVAGCGVGASRFDASVAEVRAAVDAGDRAGALDALDRLASDGLVAYQQGAIDDGDLQEMASLIESSRALVDQALPAATSTTAAPTTTTTTAPPAPPKDTGKKDAGKGKGHGKD